MIAARRATRPTAWLISIWLAGAGLASGSESEGAPTPTDAPARAGFREAVLSVTDIDAALDFWTEVVGW